MCVLDKLDKYIIDLKGLSEHSAAFAFDLDNSFFNLIEGSEIRNGEVHVDLSILEEFGTFKLIFTIVGFVYVPCDLCLDDMQQSINYSDVLKVKFGDKIVDDGSDTVIINEYQGVINVSWYIYEFIMLSIPLKHSHPIGLCNPFMVEELNKHLCIKKEKKSSVANEDSDPRWNKLKEL